MTTALTPRQSEVYHFILDHLQTHGFAPTVRDIADEHGIASPNGVVCHLRALEKKGYISHAEGLARGIRVTDGGVCPTCGRRLDDASENDK